MRFFLDRNIPKGLAEIVSLFDRSHQVDFHDQHFDQSTTDTDWLTTVKDWAPRPAIVSGDLGILRNQAEAQVLRDTGLTFFALQAAWPTLKWEDQAWKFLKVWPCIREAAAPRRPSIYLVPVSASKVEFLCHTAQLGSGHRRI